MDVHKSAGKDLLDRKALIDAYTRLLTLPEGPRVLSVEAGYGEGKTVFARLWRGELAKEGSPHAPVLFNAWESDGADDPLAVFIAALASAVPLPEGQERKRKAKKVMGAFMTIGAAGARAVGTAVVGRAVDGITDGIGDLIDAASGGNDETGEGSETSRIVEALATGDDTIDKALTQAVMQQLVALATRRKALPSALENIYRSLIDPCACDCEGRDEGGCEGKGPCAEKPECKCECGKVIVLIDELDRCRPDFAVGLLEAIKHLFEDHPGFRFVLMLNPGRLEGTAGALFGQAEGGERYLTKFIDQRLRLPSDEKGRRGFMEWLARPEWLGAYTPWVQGLDVLEQHHTINLSDFVKKYGFSLRETAQAFQTARLTFALHKDEPVDPAFLIALALCQHRDLRESILYPDSPQTIWREIAVYGATVDAHPAIQSIMAEWNFNKKWAENEKSNDNNDWQQSEEIKKLRQEIYKFDRIYRHFFGDFQGGLRGSVPELRANENLNKVKLPHIASHDYKEPDDEWAIRCFVVHHLKLLNRTAALAIPDNPAI